MLSFTTQDILAASSALLLIFLYFQLPRRPQHQHQKLGTVLAVSKSSTHQFSKPATGSINLVVGLGVEGDCHAGATVQHLSRMKIKPSPPNLRQVHLMQSELFQEFLREDESGMKHVVYPGDLGENITTVGIDLLGLGAGTKLTFVNPNGFRSEKGDPVVRVTGLRNPCPQIHRFQNGLQERCLVRDADRTIVKRKAGIMSVVEVGGNIVKGASIVVEEPEKCDALECV